MTHHDLVPPPPRTDAEFPVLDTLRAVGALCVLTTHVAFWSGDYLRHGVGGSLLGRLDVGVAIFFVLSGFLLSRPWVAAGVDPRVRPPATRRYLWNRAVRILPLYLVTVALALAFVHDNRDLGAGERLSTLAMLSTITGSSFPAGLTHMWSLAAEVQFYLLLPLVMALVVGRRLRPARVATGLGLLVGVAVWWHLDGAARVSAVATGAPLVWLPAYLVWFSAGILLAVVQVGVAQGRVGVVARALLTLARQPGSCWVAVVGLMLVAATPVAGPTVLAAPTPGESLTRSLLYAVVGFLIVLTGVFADPAGRYARWMAHPAGRRLGWISYSLFCLHLPVLHLVMWTTGWPLFDGRGPAIWVLTVVASLAVADLAYRLVERPALRLKRRPRDEGTVTTHSRPTSGTSAT